MPLKRNPSDAMNNYFINSAALAFTELEEQLKQVASDGERRRVERFQTEVENRKQSWQKVILDTFATQGNKYTAVARRDLGLKPEQVMQRADDDAKSS